MLSVNILRDLLEEHDGFVVEVNLIKLLFDSELDVEFFSESSTSWSMELEGGNVMVLTRVGSDVSAFLDLQWNVETVNLERGDLEVNWDNNILENLGSST